MPLILTRTFVIGDTLSKRTHELVDDGTREIHWTA